jgi:hypothetical protein
MTACQIENTAAVVTALSQSRARAWSIAIRTMVLATQDDDHGTIVLVGIGQR